MTVFDSSNGSINRRDFVRYGVAAAALAGVSHIASAMPYDIAAHPLPDEHGPGDVYRRAIVIDSMVLADAAMDAAKAIAAGITAAVLDMQMYPRSFENATAELAKWNARFAEPGSSYLNVLRRDDITTAKANSKLGVILACQDASILGASTFSVNDANIKNLEGFHAQGLRVLQLTHNERNAIGDSFQEKTNSGLSRLGEAVVASMNRLRMLIDMSHCGEQTCYEAISLSTRPCAVTHGACQALYYTGRAKSDGVIRALAEKGGYFGIFNMSVWLTDKDTVSVDTVVNHIDHAVKIAGVDHVGFGGDGALEPTNDHLKEYVAGMTEYFQRTSGWPGSENEHPKHIVVPELNSVERMERLAFALSRRGYSDDAVEKIIGGNFARIFGEVCG